MLGQRPRFLFYRIRRQHIICADQLDVFSLAEFQAVVPVARHAEVLFIFIKPDPLIRYALYDRYRIVL